MSRVLAQTKPETRTSAPTAFTPRRGRALTLQRKCACGGVPGPTGECESCRQKRLSLRRAARVGSSPVAAPVPSSVHDVLRSAGEPLDHGTRSSFERRFGHGFANVRVHTDARATESARAVDAQAYTVGRHVVFDAGQYSPRTTEGRRLLTHELTHVVQQRQVTDATAPLSLDADPVMEREAESAAAGSLVDIPTSSQRARAVARQQRPTSRAAAPGRVTRVYITCPDTIEFETTSGILSYTLTNCDIPSGEYNASVNVTGNNLSFNFGEAVQAGQRFDFSYSVAPGQVNPAQLFRANRESVPVTVTQAAEPGAEGAGGQATIPVQTEYELAGTVPILDTGVSGQPSGAQGTGSLLDVTGGTDYAAAGLLGVPGTGSLNLGATGGSELDPDQFAPGLLGAPGQSTLRFLNPLPGSIGQGPGTYTRYFGPATQEGAGAFFQGGRLSMRGDLRPRVFQGGDPEALLEAERVFRTAEVGGTRMGVTPQELNDVARLLRTKSFAALAPEELALVRRVVAVHSQIAGGTPRSPLLSMTELLPEQAMRQLPPTATNRAYVVRVRMNPQDVGRVNELLGDMGGTERLAGELEVVAARDLTNPNNARILSIRANPGGMLGGTAGTVLRVGGTLLMVVGAALTVRDVLTARGPRRREIQGRAFGSFAGGVALGAFGAGLCIGLGVATAGIGLLACGLGFGIAGAIGGGAAGGWFGSLFD